MMRLIDAEELLEMFNEKVDIVTALTDTETAKRFNTFCLVADAVDNCHAVDAVPVSYIRKWIENHPTDYTTVESMLTDWREVGDSDGKAD